MHIPDNYLSPSTCAIMGAAMIPAWTISVKKVKEEVTKEKMPLLGIGAAFSFLVMMFDVPLPGGTTGHAVGAPLLAILLGPYSACIAMTIALLLQALLFGDGGILAFGANCFNMAFVIPFLSYYLYKVIKSKINSESGTYIAALISSYIALNAGALLAAIEFGIQPLIFKDASGMPIYCPYPPSVSIPAMLIPHLAVAGVVEAIITAGVYGFVKKVSPGSIYGEHDNKAVNFKPLYIFLIIIICLTPIGLLADGEAWGEWGPEDIETVTTAGEELGYVPSAMEDGFEFNALIPDYAIEGVPEVVGYILSAVIALAIFMILFKIIASFKKSEDEIN